EVFVRSFYDGTGDGKGDFVGLTARLDYLNDGNPATTTDLGITAIWLMPMMQSPSYHGYDVTNYNATEPDYGTMVEFEAFLAAAHARGIKVIIDLVLNHSSNQHLWFAQSASAPTNPKRDWYRWSATRPGTPGPWGQTVWHPRNGAYYYGLFYDGMPDLNWRNPDLKAAMWAVSRYWLAKGVDGYRLDAVKYLLEDGDTLESTHANFRLLEELHDSVRAVNPQAVTVGEAWSTTNAVVPYVQNDRLDLCFEFDLAASILNSLNAGSPARLRAQLNHVSTAYPTLQYATFLTNHDQNRVLDVLGGDLAKMKQAATLYLTMPGVPFLYYGEEVGMSGTGPDEDKRLPMQWTAGPRAGFTTGTPWRAPNANYPRFNVATMAADPASLLNHYKKLIGLRVGSEALRKGYYLPVTSASAPVLTYARIWQQEAVVVVANMGPASAPGGALSLPISSLPAGLYDATDLTSGQSFGSITLDSTGGFRAWTPAVASLGANQTWVLRLAPRPTGVRPAVAATDFQLYPNPADARVRIELATAAVGNCLLRVYDLRGRLLRTVAFSGGRYDLDTHDLSTGSYFVQLTAGRAVTMQRLMVTR
ncbi:MAG: T9SS type A sorting domain-containing protein, partial [Hymenobacteraceae bacterium]|nr:T9SS type A sorting domain-containing protein [Hymenobacteraceae bacterium]